MLRGLFLRRYLIGLIAFMGASRLWAATPLIDAVKAGDQGAVAVLLQRGAEVDASEADGTTPLMWAAYGGDVAIARLLVTAGAKVAATNAYGATAMAEAAALGDPALIELLLEAGVDANTANPEGETALMAVARTGNVAAARLLIDAGADVDATEAWGGQSALMWAAAQLQPEMVSVLIEAGAALDARGAVRNWQRRITAEGRPKDMNRGGFTPLLYATRGGCLECAKRLVGGGADVNLPDPEGVTPLILAITNFHFDVADYLVEAGADLDRWDLFGRTALYAATDMNTIPSPDRPGTPSYAARALIEKLLRRGANPNTQLKLRRPEFRNAIGERGADNSIATGATPLLRAAHAGDVETIKLLLAHGALVDLPTATGLTPLMAAAGLGVSPRSFKARFKTEAMGLESVRLLHGAGADVNAAIADRRRLEQEKQRDLGGPVRYHSVHIPPNGQTAIFGAARHGYNEVIEFLAANGARIDLVDAKGQTAFDMALARYEAVPLDPPQSPRPETAALLAQLCAATAGCRVPAEQVATR
jgi:ankyrin repeat protein